MEAAGALREHIMQAIARGAQRKDIEQLLVSAGWPREIVKEYISEAEEIIPTEPAFIRLRDVTKRFGNNVVLDHVNLEIPPGELFGIIGLSGVGKTTLLNTIVGFIEPDEGDVVLQLSDNREISVHRAKHIVKNMFGFAAQVPSFYEKLTVRENIEHFAALYNIPQVERISKCDRLLKLVGLENAQHTLAQNLSGGMQKRLDIACAIVHEPSVLILDEPTADLDPIIRDQIWALIRQINQGGTTVIVASHVVSELEQYCSRIAILRNQRITEVGTTSELRDIYSRKYEIFLKTAQKEYSRIKAFCNKNRTLYSALTEKDNCFVAETFKPHEALKHLIAFLVKSRINVISMRVERPSIAEVFASLVKNGTNPIH
mgnify:CR=1 FL=1